MYDLPEKSICFKIIVALEMQTHTYIIGGTLLAAWKKLSFLLLSHSAFTWLLKENNVNGFACFPSYPCCVRYHPCCHGAFTAGGDSRGVIAPDSGEQATEVF